MKKSHKIILALGVGLGIAYAWNRNKKKKATTNPTLKPSDKPMDVENNPESTTEKMLYIIENTDANVVEETTGFDGVKFEWNPVLGKMYPKGTLTEEQMPAYADAVFFSADGKSSDDPTVSLFNDLSRLNDAEIGLAYNLVKYRKRNPSAISEEDAFKEITGEEREKILFVIKDKIKPILNDIKALKKHPEFSNKWNERKKALKSKIVSACGERPLGINERKQYHQCVRKTMAENKANKTELKTVKQKGDFSEKRQMTFAEQVATRKGTGMFGGRRWDGKTNDVEEALVRQGKI